MSSAAPARFAVEAGEFVDHRFRAMGCDIRIFAAPHAGEPAADLLASVSQAEAFVHASAARLTRFDEQSELRRLEADPRPDVQVSPLLAHAIHLAVETAASTDGLIDPTLTSAVEQAGYGHDWNPTRRIPLVELLTLAPPRHPAQGATEGRWQAVRVDLRTNTVSRPPGVRLDLGATAKGWIADLALRSLSGAAVAFIDAGGDLALDVDHLEVTAADPFGSEPVTILARGRCGVATSSIADRCWRTAAGVAHHLIDPSSGRPAFTGVVQATACAPSAAAAERIAGQALLAGPDQARRILAVHGGAFVTEDGATHSIEPGTAR